MYQTKIIEIAIIDFQYSIVMRLIKKYGLETTIGRSRFYTFIYTATQLSIGSKNFFISLYSIFYVYIINSPNALHFPILRTVIFLSSTLDPHFDRSRIHL